MSREQDVALTWVIGDWHIYVTHFEGDAEYNWNVRYMPDGWEVNGYCADQHAAVYRVLDVTQELCSGNYTDLYTFITTGTDITVEVTPQTTVGAAWELALEKLGYPYTHVPGWDFALGNGLPVDSKLSIGLYRNKPIWTAATTSTA